LRFFSPDGELIPTPEERATTAEQETIVAQQQVEAERQQRELAEQRVEKLLARLRDLGVDPDALQE
jgi:hypothetical protein